MKKLLMVGIAFSLLLSLWFTTGVKTAQDIPIDPLGVPRLQS